MFKAVFNEKNLVRLIENSTDDRKSFNSLKPVYYEELKLLGLNEFLKIPKSKYPLMWTSSRRYYYDSELIFETRGGNYFESPKLVLKKDLKELHLKPINVKLLVSLNEKILKILENEAMDFIDRTYRFYKKLGYRFAVAFSGGKDSQVVLSLVSQVIPSKDFLVIFSDTKMEIDSTYKIFEKTKEKYQKMFPDLKFEKAIPLRNAIELWKDFGVPSRINRWCCTVTKTVPFVNKIRELTGERNAKIVVFDGVRSEESFRRSNYSRISEGSKHLNQVNAEVIKNWNTIEVYLYMYYKNLEINEGYKLGLQRVGCSVCPFASNWSEFILSKKYKSLTNVYLEMIKKSAKNLGINSNKKIKEYIIQGQWKKRAGGEAYLNNNDKEPYMLIKKSKDKISFVIRNKRENLYEWLKTIGEIYYKRQDEKILGEIRFKNNLIFFKDEYIGNNEIIEFGTYGNSIIESKLKKILFKTTYCINCGACQIECPTNALTIIPKVKVDLQKCIHCSNCLNITQRGCLVAKSMQMSEGVGVMNTKKSSGFGKYLTFGMREKWLEEYLKNPENWFEKNTLGNKQVESMKAWLLDSELIDKNKQPTELTDLLKNIYDKDKNFVWEIVWINLCFNSSLCNFYSENFEWNETYSIAELKAKTKETLINDGIKVSERTIDSGIGSLINMFENSSLGKELKIGFVERFRGKRFLRKLPYKEVNPISIGYLIYKISEKLGKKEFSISELGSKDLSCNPYKIFGISKNNLEFYLRTLQEKYRLLNVELAADLDNVFLDKNIKVLDVIKVFGGI